MTRRKPLLRLLPIWGVLCALTESAGCAGDNNVGSQSPAGTVLRNADARALHEELTASITATSPSVLTRPGLVGAIGGARVKLQRGGAHKILLPVPQRVDGQVPIFYVIHAVPADALLETRWQKRADASDVATLRLNGSSGQEIQLHWSAVILVTGKTASPQAMTPEAYRSASACAQSEASAVKELAGKLWPEGGRAMDYARNIQRFIREMKLVQPPRSLDASGILRSGANGICTANANLAVALLRAKGIAALSMAVIPTTSQRLEMHRIVQCFDAGEWFAFDPSSLHADVPMKPWQSIIMARTTLADEDRAMKPRAGVTVGSPYAQELELLSTGINPWGEDFFWTMAKPLVELNPNEDVLVAATSAWDRYVREGTLSAGQRKARQAKSSDELLELLKAK